MAVTLATYMLWTRASQVISSLFILSSNGFLIHLSKFLFFSCSMFYVNPTSVPDAGSYTGGALNSIRASSNSYQSQQKDWD